MEIVSEKNKSSHFFQYYTLPEYVNIFNLVRSSVAVLKPVKEIYTFLINVNWVNGLLLIDWIKQDNFLRSF